MNFESGFPVGIGFDVLLAGVEDGSLKNGLDAHHQEHVAVAVAHAEHGLFPQPIRAKTNHELIQSHHI